MLTGFLLAFWTVSNSFLQYIEEKEEFCYQPVKTPSLLKPLIFTEIFHKRCLQLFQGIKKGTNGQKIGRKIITRDVV